MSKLAIIGASYLQEPLVRKAKEMGLEVHCFAWEEGAVCKDIADYFYPISIVEKELILEKCQEIGIDGITTIASDVAAPTVAYVANKMGLIGNDYDAAVCANNKYLMRNAFIKAGVPCPKYIMFSDQDDVWCENKIEVTANEMKKAEEQYPGEAILVHTDLYVVDSELNITDPSFFHRMRIQPERKRIARFLTENTVTGCTMMINRRLKDIIGHIPQEAVMHDWWAAFCASGMGHICTLYTPTMYYRQHENNTIGVDNNTDSRIKWVMKYLFSKDRILMIRRIVEEKFLSAKRFYADYANRISSDDRELCKRFLHLKEVGHISQLRCICKDNFFDRSFGEKIMFWLLLIR